jgi:predicted nucleotidyltransferase
VLSQPNTILAIEYLRAIKRFAPSLTPVIIPRKHSNYHDTEITSSFASASAVRRALLNGDNDSLRFAVPPSSLSLIKQRITEGCGPVIYESFATAILYKLRTAQLADLAELPDIAEGLHHKLAAEALRATTVEDLLSRVKSKRYTRTRLQRTLIHALLGLSKQQIALFDECGPLYARVLAFNANGRYLLKQMSECSSVPIITKTAHFLNTKQRNNQQELTTLGQMLAIDTLASDIYSLGAPGIKQRLGADDFHRSPAYINQ